MKENKLTMDAKNPADEVFIPDNLAILPKKIGYTVYRDVKDPPTHVISTFEKLEELCSSPNIRDAKDGPAFCPATFKGESRAISTAETCSFLAFDLDDLPDSVKAEQVLGCIKEYRAFCYSTYSHGVIDKGNRFRVVIAANESIPADRYKGVAGKIADRFGSLKGKVDHAGMSPVQLMYFSACCCRRRKSVEFWRR